MNMATGPLPGYSYDNEAIQQPLKLLLTNSLVLHQVSFQMEIQRVFNFTVAASRPKKEKWANRSNQKSHMPKNSI